MKLFQNFVLIALLVVPLQLVAQTKDEVLDAVNAGVKTKKQFKLVSDFVKSSDEENEWRKVDWIPNLWEGTQIASEKEKPLFIWAMNGDPLGCV